MLDVAKQKAFEQSVKNELSVPTKEKGFDWRGSYRWVVNFINGKSLSHNPDATVRDIANLIERVGAVDSKLVGFADKLDSSVSSIKSLKTAHSEINGLLADLKADASASLVGLSSDLTRLTRALGATPTQFDGMSAAEMKKELLSLYNQLSSKQQAKVTRACDQIKDSIEAAMDPVFRAHAVVNMTESFAAKLTEERKTRGLDLTHPGTATAFTSAITAAFSGLSSSIANLRKSNAREAILQKGFGKAAEDAVKTFTTKLDSDLAVAHAGPMLAQIDAYTSMLSGGQLNLDVLPNNTLLAPIPNGVKSKLLDRLNADIPASERSEIQSALATLTNATTSQDKRQVASELIKEKFAGINEKLQNVQKLVDGVCLQFAEVVDCQKKITRMGTAMAVLFDKEKALEVFAATLIEQVKAEMVADLSPAGDIATEVTAITKRFLRIQGSLTTAIESKLEKLLADTTVATAEMVEKCTNAVKKGLDLLDESKLKARFPADQDSAARTKGMDDLEKDLQKALA